MKYFLSLFAALLIVVGMGPRTFAQVNDSLPQLAAGRLDWGPYRALAPQRFNQKDYAVYMVRVNKFHEIFETDPRQQWVDDFHFFDLNGDLMPDAIYSGSSQYFKGDRSLIMIGDTALQYPITFDQPGYIQALEMADTCLKLTVVQEASGIDYRVNLRRFRYDHATDTATQLWGLQYLSTTQIPPNRNPAVPLVLRRPTYLRTSAEIISEPAIDYDQDGHPDGVGNIIADLQPGLPLLRLWQEIRNGEDWSFVILLEAPSGKHLFSVPPNDKIPQGYAGWLPSKAME
ncbi:MAG: hypothetical protein AAF998_02420 [Bacteroidota bacterium]